MTANPLKTVIGEYIADGVHMPLSGSPCWPEHKIWLYRLLKRAMRGAVRACESDDRILKAETGKDSCWWMNWIRKQRGNGYSNRDALILK